jgi:hypothetical protein
MKRTLIIAVFIIIFITACSGNQDALTPDSPENSMLENVIAEYNNDNNNDNNSDDTEDNDVSVTPTGTLIISFDFERQSGWASNQFAVWIEDTDGNFVTTLYATRYTANGGFKDRPESISEWVNKSGLAVMEQSEIDAISGATPQTGRLSYTWDLTDTEGNTVPSGEYRFFVEGSLRWSNRVIYSGIIDIGGETATVKAEPQYFYTTSGNQNELTEESPENAMVGNVEANLTP